MNTQHPSALRLRSASGSLAPGVLAALAHAPVCDPAEARGRLRPGERLGRYVLLRELGRGGFGVVFEALDEAGGGRVAVKVARPGPRSAQARALLERERLAPRFRHPNVVSVLDAGTGPRGPYLVFELLRGETLRDRLRREPRLEPAEALGVAIAIARALAHVHARGVVHRDLSPANVFLPREGAPRLLDFGLATGPSGQGVPPGSGTPGYMAPEQRGGAPGDARTDLHALGLLLGELVDRASMPAGLARLAAALVEADPARRPSSAGLVLARLLELRTRLLGRGGAAVAAGGAA